MIKKLLAASLAAAMALSISVPSFALPAPNAAGDVVLNLTTITGQPVLDTGVQVSSKPSVGSTSETLEPNQAIYFALPDSLGVWASSASNCRISSRKIKNGKMIKSIRIVEKKLASGGTALPILVPSVATPTGAAQTAVAPKPAGNIGNSAFSGYDVRFGNARNTYLEVVLNDTTSADEFKVEFSVTLTAKKAPSKAGNLFYGIATDINDTEIAHPTNQYAFAKLAAGNKVTLNGALYISNAAHAGSTTVSVGSKGLTVKPVGNDDNEITFDNEETLATLRFRANSNPSKFYAKLSTKWTTALLAKFRDTDAVIRAFSPATIDATSRAELLLNNPYDDSINPKNVRIYSVSAKGVITDVTRNFTYDEDEDVFTTKTRTLGTWVISDVKIKLK